MTIKSIPAPADPEAPTPVPPCSGNWLRAEDGTLTPADEATARAAGLWEEPAAPETPEPSQE